MAAAIETALLAPLSPAEKPAGTATVEKLDGQGEAAHAFQDAAVTQEELDRLTVPDGISDADRAQRYLSSGEAVQQVAVIENLPGLLRAAGRGVFPAISRGLVEAARQLDGEGQLAAADSFATVARERLLGPAELADVVLPLVLAGVGDDGHPQAQASWLACLQELAAALDPATLHARVLPAVAARGGGAGRLLRERCLCCQLLGALALHVDEEDLKRSLLRLAAALCQDTEWQVRHAACQQLPALAAAAAAKLEEAALEGVLEELFGLLGDEEALVRAAAWRALAAALDLLPPRLRRARALPALLRQCREPEHHAEVHRAVTAGFGVLLTRMVADMEGEGEVNACLLYYRGQAWRHDHATRINCAAAFPAVLRAATPRRYGSHLHDTFARLAADGDPEVRLAAAEGLPEVAAALGPDRCCQYLRQPAAALLQDERREVQAALLARLPQLLHAFCPEPPAEEARHKAAAAFVEPLLRLEAASGHSWRLQLALLQAMACFPAFFAPEALHDRFLPLAWKHMAEGAAAVRGAAAAAAAAIWRALRKQHQRTGLYSRLVHDFGQSKSFRQRIAFVDFCCHAQTHFSSRFIKAHLLEAALTLAYDPVAAVRMRLAAAMPALRAALALPDDVHLLERLNSGMSHLITDGDADVRREARKATEELKRLPVRISCGAVEGSPPELKELEAADAARVEAEKDFLFDPEHVDRIHADIAAYDEQLRPSNARLVLGGAARGDAMRAEAVLRVNKLSKQKSLTVPLTVPLGGGGTAQQSQGRSSSEVVESRRERVAVAGGQAPRSASADVSAALGRKQEQRAGGRGALTRLGSRGEAGAGRTDTGAGRGKAAARPRNGEAGHVSAASAAGPTELPAGGDVGRGDEASRSAEDAVEPREEEAEQPQQQHVPQQQQQQQRQQQKPGGGTAAAGSGGVSRQSPGSAGKTQAPGKPAAGPSPPSPAAKRTPGAALLAPLPVAGAIPAAAAAAAASGAGAGLAGLGPTTGALSFSAAPAAGRGVRRRPSLKAAATRAAAEVQQLAAKLRSAMLSGEAGAGAAGVARPLPQRLARRSPARSATTQPASKAGLAPTAAMQAPADGRVSPVGGGCLAPGVRSVAQGSLGRG